MRPAVTFALFAYNQENYVREAIEGAFAQQFSSMEIILSDDCSSDGTFAIMQEMAAAYDGPHSVIARREDPNAGTVRHLINVARAGSGDFLVVAAGDDISYPDRAARLHATWKQTGAAALSSWHDEIDDQGKLLGSDLSFQTSAVTQILFRHSATARRVEGVVQAIPGFTAAYPRSLWAEMPDPADRLFVEDGLATILLNLRGESIVRVPHSLVAYRLLDTSLSNRKGGLDAVEVMARERKIDFLARDQVGLVDHVFAVAKRDGIAIDAGTRRQLERHRNHGQVIASYWDQGPLGRVARLTQIRMREDAAYLFPRLAGRTAFVALRLLNERRRSRRSQG